MRQYLGLLQQIFEDGIPKHPSRIESGETVNGTRGIANLHFSHDLRSGFPLCTTRKIPWKATIGELRTFLLGQTRQEDFLRNGCGFWMPWAANRPNGDLGPIYGAQWNAHGQLQHVLDCLRNRPTDRRMVVSAWRPDEHAKMALPPCHLLWDVTIYGDCLSLAWVQRSCDFVKGVPVNIASYALLTHLLAAWAELKPGDLSALFCDAHIYDNQREGVAKWLKREPKKPPQIAVWFRDQNDFHSWDCQILNWDPMPSDIDFGAVEV